MWASLIQKSPTAAWIAKKNGVQLTKLKTNITVRYLKTTKRWHKMPSYPLLAFIQQQLNSENKINLLVGHDSNIVALLAALGVEPYELNDSLENIPIGGKLLFEVWKHKPSGKLKFKLDYVYQTTEQLINITPLSLATPPKPNSINPQRL